jgi:hypothetical protein
MKSIKHISIVLAVMLFSAPIRAQKIVINEKTGSLFEQKNDFGPAQKRFKHLYLGYGLMLDNPNFQNIRLEAWRSNSITTGWRTQYKIWKFYSLGTDLFYNYSDFAIKQYDGKTFPDLEIHQKEKLSFHNAGTEIYQRITFFKRGKLMGTFLDAGIYGSYVFLSKYTEKDKFDEYNNNAKIRVITYRRLNYTENYQYGVHARLGFNKWAIASGYRLSNLLKNTNVCLPPIWFELQLGLHK